MKIVTLGDLHWGALDPNHLTEELDEIFYNWIVSNKVDAIIQLGDYFDKRLSLDSADSKAAFHFAVKICQFCQKNNILFRICKGGIAHDFFQLDNFRALEAEYSVFRIIGTAQHEELFPLFDVLWLPEEYPTNYEDFYNQFLFNEEGDLLRYDAIFGHGEIDVAAGWSRTIESERHYGGTPTHSAEFLLEHSSSVVQFGHIHKRFRYKKLLGYPGSFTRWQFGEEEPKGFEVLDLKFSEKTNSWTTKVQFVENTVASQYKTFAASEILDVTDTIDELVRKIQFEATQYNKLRVKMLDFPIGIEELSILRGSLLENQNISIVTTAQSIIQTNNTDEEDLSIDEDNETKSSLHLDYLRDYNLTGEEKLLKYIHEKFLCTEITLDDVRELTSPLT
jgi:DNA repair exonuclease SbcCD nuclease subunit